MFSNDINFIQTMKPKLANLETVSSIKAPKVVSKQDLLESWKFSWANSSRRLLKWACDVRNQRSGAKPSRHDNCLGYDSIVTAWRARLNYYHVKQLKNHTSAPMSFPNWVVSYRTTQSSDACTKLDCLIKALLWKRHKKPRCNGRFGAQVKSCNGGDVT